MRKYDIWLQWDVTRLCNFDCRYCFNPNQKTKYKPEDIDISKLLKTLSESGKKFRIGFTGGEPFLINNIVDVMQELVDAGNTVSVNSNLSKENFNDLVNKVDPSGVLFVHGSFHWHELKRKNMLERFVNNYKLIEAAGFNIYCEAIAYPEYVKDENEIRKFADYNKLRLRFAPFIGGYKGRGYPESYTLEEEIKYSFKDGELEAYFPKGEACNAGYNAAVVYSNGEVYKCFNIKQRLGNIYDKVVFENTTSICQQKICGCPLNYYDSGLLKKGLIDSLRR